MSAFWFIFGACAVKAWGWRAVWIMAATVGALNLGAAIIGTERAGLAGAYMRGFIVGGEHG